jgi:hypothetical protein
MDNKQIIEKLMKIARNQQKIIEKLAQVIPNPAMSSPPPPQAGVAQAPKHLSEEGIIKQKLGTNAGKVTKLYVVKQNLASGADFKVQYVASQKGTDLEKIVGDAVVAVQTDPNTKTSCPGFPAGKFYVEPWQGTGLSPIAGQ